VVTVVEWSDIVSDVLRKNRISIKFELTPNDPDERLITITYPENEAGLIKTIETEWEEVEP
jgi:tRNA A37 threonylcarbamoyladenosine biosynthesis protein TsaE